jgi:hypothetical protein
MVILSDYSGSLTSKSQRATFTRLAIDRIDRICQILATDDDRSIQEFDRRA